MFIILIDLKCFSNTIHMFIAIYKNLQKIIAPPPIKKDQKKKNNNSKKKTGRRNTKQKPKQNKIPKTVVAMINENMRLFSKILNYLSFHLKEITQIQERCLTIIFQRECKTYNNVWKLWFLS